MRNVRRRELGQRWGCGVGSARLRARFLCHFSGYVGVEFIRTSRSSSKNNYGHVGLIHDFVRQRLLNHDYRCDLILVLKLSWPINPNPTKFSVLACILLDQISYLSEIFNIESLKNYTLSINYSNFFIN